MRKPDYVMVFVLGLMCASAMAQKEAIEKPETLADLDRMPKHLELTQACLLALRNNPGINSTREQLVQQDGVLKEAKAASRPHLSGSGYYETFDDTRVQSFGEGISAESTRWNASLNANLTVFSGKRNYHHIKGQEAVKRSIASGVVTDEEDLLVFVHAAYYAAWLSDQNVSVQKEAIAVLEEQLQIAENKFKAGVGEKYDVTQAEVALANAQPPLIRAMNDRRRNTDTLQQIIGLPYPEGVGASDISIEPLEEIASSDMPLSEAIAAGMANRPELERIRHDMESARRSLRVVSNELVPEVALYAGYGIESDMFGSSSSLEGWNGGVSFSWSIMDGGARRGKVDQAESTIRQVTFHNRELELAIMGEVRNAYYNQQEAKSIYKASALAIEQAREALQLAQNRYKAGKGTQLEVLESRLQLTQAQLEQFKARHDIEIAEVEMKRATGVGIMER